MSRISCQYTRSRYSKCREPSTHTHTQRQYRKRIERFKYETQSFADMFAQNLSSDPSATTYIFFKFFLSCFLCRSIDLEIAQQCNFSFRRLVSICPLLRQPMTVGLVRRSAFCGKEKWNVSISTHNWLVSRNKHPRERKKKNNRLFLIHLIIFHATLYPQSTLIHLFDYTQRHKYFIASRIIIIKKEHLK